MPAYRKVYYFPLILLLLVMGCIHAAPTKVKAPDTPTTPVSPADTASDWYSVYFTDPTGLAAEYYSGGPDEALAQAINRARASIDVAIYELDLSSVSNALIKAHRRGVTVRVVTESDAIDMVDSKIPALKAAGIPVLGDRREGLMHNKFTVIDHSEVWSGSMNYTSNDAYRNDNNLIRIQSTQLAEDYTTEFNEMFVEDLFGPDIRPATPYPTVDVNGTQIEVYFSPDDGVAQHIIDQISQAQESVYFLAFSFTANAIAKAMRAQIKDGFEFAGVFEESQVASSKNSNEYDPMRAAGLDVWLDANPKNMHNKVILIDGKIVITGSYNFSASAEKTNDENTMIIHNAEITALYYQDFQRIYQRAKK
jgi:phosphatidylserine/phosphatidylglycerophosphate/cardiolipin synthase-like enzyme